MKQNKEYLKNPLNFTILNKNNIKSKCDHLPSEYTKITTD